MKMSDHKTNPITAAKAPIPKLLGHVDQTVSAMNQAALLCQRVERLRDLLCGNRPQDVNEVEDVPGGVFNALSKHATQLVDAINAANESIDFIEGHLR
jgi:hypothetical protein